MRLFIFLILQALLFFPLTALAAEWEARPTPHIVKQNNNDVTEVQKTAVIKTYGNLPLYFIENNGQVDKAVKFYERGAGHATFFTSDGVVISLTKNKGKVDKAPILEGVKADKNKETTTEALTLSFAGANDKPKIIAGDKKNGQVNYFIGNDKSEWRTNIPTYGAVTYKDVYKNIDIRFYGNNRQLEHDVIVRPGGNFSAVIFAYKGARGLKVTEEGNLEVSLKDGKIIEEKPVIYQKIKGKRVTVDGSYRLFGVNDGAFEYGFTVASYDHTKDLVIDPVLVYSTYLGGNASDDGSGIAVDSSGAAYISGNTCSADFPVVSPIQAYRGCDAFITKINPAGSALVYSTYLGGNFGEEFAPGIAVDSTGAVYLTGTTRAADFPLVNPIQAVSGGNNEAFISKINPAGSALVYSTYLGGNNHDNGFDIVIDSLGAAYVSGNTISTDFPLVNPLQGTFGGTWDAFVTKVNPAGSAFVYSTYLGGSDADWGYGIALDTSGNVYVTGKTASPDFPLMNPIQGALGGISDAFVTEVNAAGSAFVYSTYLGGSDAELGNGIAIDTSGNIYVTGATNSLDFPLMNPLQGSNTGGYDIFVTKLNPAGSAFIYSTYLGGSLDDSSSGMALDASNNIYLTGSTKSADFPTATPIQGSIGGSTDGYVTMINATGSALIYSTYLGGSALDWGSGIVVDTLGAAYITGASESTNFPTASPFQGVYTGTRDVIITKIDGTPPPPLPVITVDVTPDTASVPRGGVLGYSVTLTNTTASTHCFQYWENVNLPGGATYPANGSLYNPVPRACFRAGKSYTVHLTHGVPMFTPVGAYVFNAYDGIYPVPFRVVVDTASFNFSVTAFGPLTNHPETSWRLIENGFRR